METKCWLQITSGHFPHHRLHPHHQNQNSTSFFLANYSRFAHTYTQHALIPCFIWLDGRIFFIPQSRFCLCHCVYHIHPLFVTAIVCFFFGEIERKEESGPKKKLLALCYRCSCRYHITSYAYVFIVYNVDGWERERWKRYSTRKFYCCLPSREKEATIAEASLFIFTPDKAIILGI